ncbi:MAG TPA: MOSC N-terminal beta barrel domain-containing protein [Actinomycetes bacterium]|nr:MOSC N-terminal beta barrel domain-containing protein [Actinomycetes bacterium]
MSSLRVTTLFTTPVKGFALHSRESVEIDDNGAVGDRDFFMVDEQLSLVSITRIGTFAAWQADFDPASGTLTLRSADGDSFEAPTPLGREVVAHFFDERRVTGHVVEGPWSDWLSDAADRRLMLVRAAASGGAYDEHPVTLLGESSVAELGQHAPGGSLDARRFRMLIGFDGAAAYEEDTWNGHLLKVGSVQLRVRGPVPRCNATTRDPDSGVRDVKTLRLIEEHRGRTPNDFGIDLNFGVYGDVVAPGTITIGDELTLE